MLAGVIRRPICLITSSQYDAPILTSSPLFRALQCLFPVEVSIVPTAASSSKSVREDLNPEWCSAEISVSPDCSSLFHSVGGAAAYWLDEVAAAAAEAAATAALYFSSAADTARSVQILRVISWQREKKRRPGNELDNTYTKNQGPDSIENIRSKTRSKNH